MIGITIISALSLTYTSIKVVLNNVTVIISNGTISQNVTSFQAVLDKFIPLMLPIALVTFIYLMMTKKSWTIYKALMFILIVGVTGYAFGILG